MTRPMSQKRPKRRANPLSGGLKAALVIGSLVASVIGARLVAVKDAAATAARSALYIDPGPQAQPAAPNTVSIDKLGALLGIPTVIAPAPMPVSPITSTRSSR